MKLLMTADAVGGVWTYALDLARALAARGHEILLCTMGLGPSAEQRADAESIPGLRLEVSTFNPERMDAPWADVDAAGAWLLDLARTHKPDVVHLNGYAHVAPPFDAPRLVVAHACVTSRWLAVHGERVPDSWDAYRERVAAGLRAADLVVAPTRAMLDATRRLHGPFDAPCLVIPHGRDADGLAPGPKEPFALCVGRAWDEAEDVPTLDAAAERFPWEVRVAGDPVDPGSGRAATLRHARLLGKISRDGLRNQLSRASILVHPARYEPSGLAPVEGALAGCALVLSDIPPLREIWRDAALYATPGKPHAFREAMTTLAASDKLREQMAFAARRRALQLTVARMADAYEDAYRRLAHRLPVHDAPEESPRAS